MDETLVDRSSIMSLMTYLISDDTHGGINAGDSITTALDYLALDSASNIV